MSRLASAAPASRHVPAERMSSNLPRISECRLCHDPIRFVELVNGKAVPVNPAPAEKGRGVIAARLIQTAKGRTLRGFYTSATRRADATNPLRFTPHQATCTEVRRPTSPAPAPADAPLF